MTAMTHEECAALGCLHPDCLRAIGEPPSSVKYLRRNEPVETTVCEARIIDAAERIESGEPLLTVFGDLCRPPMEKL